MSMSSGSLTATTSAFSDSRNRNDLEPARVFRADLLDHFRRNEPRREIDPVHVRLRGERARDVRFRDNAVALQDVNDIGAPLRRPRALLIWAEVTSPTSSRTLSTYSSLACKEEDIGGRSRRP